jgi:hypothetical protein
MKSQKARREMTLWNKKFEVWDRGKNSQRKLLAVEKINGWPPQFFIRGVVVHLFKRRNEGGNHFLIIHIISTRDPKGGDFWLSSHGHVNTTVGYKRAYVKKSVDKTNWYQRLETYELAWVRSLFNKAVSAAEGTYRSTSWKDADEKKNN